MPSRLHRYQQAKDLHFITFSCYDRQPKLGSPAARDLFERSLEQVRRKYHLYVAGYVVMPEHVHLLLTEPETPPLATAIQSLKQSVSRSLALRASQPFWLERYYDFNVWSEKKHIEKLRYMHRNPVVRGLVAKPEDWKWSSFCHYASGLEGTVEIESFWTAARRGGLPDGLQSPKTSHIPISQKLREGQPYLSDKDRQLVAECEVSYVQRLL